MTQIEFINTKRIAGMGLVLCLTGMNALAFYNPQLGRWANRDPLEEEGGINLYEALGNNSLQWVDPFGLVLKIDPSSPADFQKHVKDCICYLINNSKNGLNLVNQAINNQNTITISPDDDGAETTGSVLDPSWGFPNPTIGLYPTSPTGVNPKDYRAAKKCHEAPPNNLSGCALVLAHELGHALYNYGEPQDVDQVENPVRKDFSLPPRLTYHCKPIAPYRNKGAK